MVKLTFKHGLLGLDFLKGAAVIIDVDEDKIILKD